MSRHTPFLKLVAKAYAANTTASEFPDLCFVFPNKRSIAFFLRYLDEEMAGTPHIEPAAVTISDLLMSMSSLAEASRYEQLFALYDEYRKLSADVPEFDRFLFWGEMILSDFNDVDRHLVDPVQLFRNLRELREINSTYLTDEQREIIRKYWGDETPDENLSKFWTHLKKNSDGNIVAPASTKFMALWEVLGPLYEAFSNRLRSQGLATDGMFYRHAAEHLRDISLPYKRYIFVGFNVLTPSEVKIFERLKARGLADFYWDYNSPAFLNERNKATRFLSQNIRSFPSIYDLGEDEVIRMPDINIIGVPSNVGQAHVAGDTVEHLAATGLLENTENAIDTAIVLADEGLFLSLIDEIPPSISCMNVTMGFKMKLTPIAVLMKSIAKMQRNVKKVHGKLCFFFENVLQLLSNPIIRCIEPEVCQRLVDYITDKRIFTIEADIIRTEFSALTPVFTPIANCDDFSTSTDYLEHLLDFLERYTTDNDSIEKLFIKSYRQELTDLMFACGEYQIGMHEGTVLGMLDRVISSSTIPLAGEPLRGLQIMGVLETRSLDFRNVIMLSMNEAVFPRRQAKKSFIPEALRRGYGMATSDFAESIFAYYFYRLLSRAENVTLVYDARTVGMKRNNEMSRYLDQLLYLFPDAHITHRTVFFDIATFEDTPIEITKTDDVMALLREFVDPEGSKRLSASSINSYIRCPLGFYLEQVEGLRFPDELNDYMDYSTYGTIVHEVMQHIYEGITAETRDKIITKDHLKRVIDSPVLIDRLVTQSVNSNFIKLDKSALDSPLNGEALVMHHVMVLIVKQLLQTELEQFAPFEFLGAEKKVSGRLKVNDSLSVNFTQTIDRIDRVNGKLRFVDYKTGSDILEASGMEKLFNHDAHAIFQLMLYCHFYSMISGNNEPIQPIIYKTRDLFAFGIRPLKIGKEVITDYHSALDDFRQRLDALITEIFDPDVPFRQAEDAGACRFCKFKQICKMED